MNTLMVEPHQSLGTNHQVGGYTPEQLFQNKFIRLSTDNLREAMVSKLAPSRGD